MNDRPDLLAMLPDTPVLDQIADCINESFRSTAIAAVESPDERTALLAAQAAAYKAEDALKDALKIRRQS